MTRRFPKEKPPREYDQDFFTRNLEDVYGNLDGVEREAGKQIREIMENLGEVGDSVAGVQTVLNQNFTSQDAPLPIPTNLTIKKIPFVPVVVMWCDPIEVIKYPYIGGIQFFASPESNFVALDFSATITYSGTCTVSSGGNVLADTSNVTVSSVPAFGQKYTGVPFWPDMRLALDSVNVTNLTKNESGSVTVWLNATPWQMTCPLSGGAVWASGDEYRFTLQRNKNLIGQGPLPFAVRVIQAIPLTNKWDRVSYYGKARFYGRGLPKHRRTGQIACASTTGFGDQELTAPTNINADASEENYYFQISWDAGHDSPEGFSGYKLYRITANNTNLLTDDTYLVDSNLQNTQYTDYGYDATNYPNGPSAGATYWYWVRTVDSGGYQTDFDTPDSDILTIPTAPTFISGAEEGSTGHGNLKNWLVKWKATGGALGYFVKYKISGGDYSLETFVPHSTAFGQDGGEDIQQFTFLGLQVNKTYTFAIKSVNNQDVTKLQSAYTEQSYSIVNSGPPSPPT
jgi:hypothetical protein